jgi:uncharacterized membrane protein
VSYQTLLTVNVAHVHQFALIFIILVVVIVAVLFLLCLVVIARAYASTGKVTKPSYRSDEPPELILARRFSSGAIDEAEYHRRLDAIRGRAAPPSD